jgi:multiple sugar transport system permease protein
MMARLKPLKLGGKDIVQETLMILPALALLAVFLVSPFMSSIQLSFTNQRLVQGPVPSRFIGLRNYIQVLSDGMFWKAFRNVLAFTILVIPVQCGTALILAILLDRQRFLKGALRGLFFVPFITPMVIVSVVWLSIYQYPGGILNSIITSVGRLAGIQLKPVLWLGTPGTALLSIVFLSAWQGYSFQMVVYLGGLQHIAKELFEAASIDGAGAWRKFASVTWPSLRNTNVLILVITTIQAFKLFTQVNILTHGGPNGATITLLQYMYETGFVAQRLGYSATTSVIFFLLVLAVFLIQRGLLMKNQEAAS